MIGINAPELKDQFGDLLQFKSETELKQENINYFKIN